MIAFSGSHKLSGGLGFPVFGKAEAEDGPEAAPASSFPFSVFSSAMYEIFSIGQDLYWPGFGNGGLRSSDAGSLRCSFPSQGFEIAFQDPPHKCEDGWSPGVKQQSKDR